MHNKRRVALIALTALAAVAVLFALPGGASAHGLTDQALAISVDGSGTVTGTGISCRDGSGDCVEFYPQGTSVTLTAVKDSGATFNGWGGDCAPAGMNTTCTLTMSSARTVTAQFTSGGGGSPTLTVSVTGNGKITGNGIDCGNGGTDCSETYSPGTSATLTETPGTGATFSGWGGACSGTSTQCTVTMNSNQVLTGTFTGGSGTSTLTVSVTGNGKVTGPGIDCGNGQTDCSEPYATGTTVQLTETPNSGATFTGWGGSCSGTTTTCNVTMSASKTVTATFSGGSQVTLTVSVSGSGRITGAGIDCGNGNTDCSETYAKNTTVQLTAAPASGATFLGWSTPGVTGFCGSGTSGSPPTTCTVTLDASKTVTGSFSTASAQRILTISVGGSGRVSGPGISCGVSASDCSESYNDGTTVVLTAVPASGATFLGWGGACSGTQLTCSVTMNGPQAVSASFSTAGTPTPRPTPGTFALRSLGRPIVVRTSVGWAVTIRFHTSRAGAALLRLSLNGRLVNAFTFSPRAGNVLVGPFNVGRAGNYRFAMTLNDNRGNAAQLIWTLCLGCSGGGSFTPAVSFVRPGTATAFRTSTGWLVKVHFNASVAGAATARMTHAGRVESSGSFTFRRGSVTVDLPARSAGLHTIVMNARNANGRMIQLRWNIVLR